MAGNKSFFGCKVCSFMEFALTKAKRCVWCNGKGTMVRFLTDEDLKELKKVKK